MLLYRGICIVAVAPCAGTGHCAAVCSTMVSDTMQSRDEWDVGVKPLQDVFMAVDGVQRDKRVLPVFGGRI